MHYVSFGGIFTDNIIISLIIDLSIITIIFTIFLVIGLHLQDNNEREETEEQKEEKSFYLRLINTTNQEILTFKKKDDFIKTIKQYDSIKYFLKGTEEENTNQLITWYDPHYERLD